MFIGVAGSIAGTFSPATWPQVVNFPYAFPILTMQATNEADSAVVLLKSVGVGLIVIFISALDAENFYKGKMA